MKFEPIHKGMAIDPSQVSIQEAAIKIGPAFIYDIHVTPAYVGWVKSVAKSISADTKENPLSPYLNIIPDKELMNPPAWYLEANGKRVGALFV